MNKKITAFTLVLSLIFPCFAFAEDELTDVAANQAAAASSELSRDTAAEAANDGINDNSSYSAWVSAESDSRPLWQTDLAMGYKISCIEIEARIDGTSEERSDFRVLVSNDPDFSEYEVVGECKSDYGKNGKWTADFEAKKRYQYVRVEKTSDGVLSIGEIRVLVNKASILYGTEVFEKNTQRPLTDEETRYELPSDIKGTGLEKEVRFLSALNVMRGYPDGKFLPYDYITRAEFATVAVHLTGSSIHVSQNTFTDVEKGYWAYDAIEACYESRLINGIEEGYFAPDENITYDQAIKIAVCALGYDELAEKQGGYPGGYAGIAAQLGILDGVTNDEGYITRGDIARLVYLSLFARLKTSEYIKGDGEILSSGREETILSKYFGLSKTKGLITEIPGLSLTDESTEDTGEDYIVVNDMQIMTDDPHYRDYFGYMAEVYYRETEPGGELEAAVIMPSDKGAAVEIDAEAAVSFDASGVLTYYDGNDRQKRISFITELDVIYNNKPLVSYIHSELIPDFGTIRAIDYDGNGKYDIMIIKAVKTYVVNWINADERIIYPKSVNGQKAEPIKFDENDDLVTLRNIEGEEIEFSQLAEWNILSVETSANRAGSKVTDIYVSDAFARGGVSAVGEEYITVKNKRYKVAETMKTGDLKPGDKGIFYLDYFGRIAAFDGDKYEDGKYGFIAKLYFDEESEKPGFRMFTSSGAFKDFLASDYLKIDGTACKTRDDIHSALLLGGGTNGALQQLVRYSANSKNELTAVDTVYKNTAYEKDSSLTKDFAIASRYYKSDSGIFGMVLTLADDAVIMRIPEDFGSEDQYEIVSRSSFANDTMYEFEAYDGGSMNKAEAVLITEKPNDSIKNNESFFIVDKVIEGLNRYDEPVSILCGYYKGIYAQYPEQSDGIIESANLKRGDILCLMLSSGNEIKKIERRFYNGERPEDAPYNSISIDVPMGPGSNNTPYWDIFMVYGTVTARDGNLIKVKADTSRGQTLTQPNYETIVINLDGSKTKKYIYDSVEDEVRTAENSDFIDAESAGSGAASTVIYRVSSGDVNDIVIIK
ncbi:MAG: S-layer homology domain-containing protein [Clostridia bacterium]|nr:S-layer homology domain-containing protein [Clostridia bacterium]